LEIKEVDRFGFSCYLQEEQSKDAEIKHNTEQYGYVAFGDGLISDENGNTVAEVGRVFVTQTGHSQWFTMSYSATFTDPVVIARLNSENYAGNNPNPLDDPDAEDFRPAHMRLKNVGTTGFEYQIEEWDYLYSETVVREEEVVFLVVEKGTHRLSPNEVLKATYANVAGGFETVDFDGGSPAHPSRPVILGQVQTVGDTTACVTRLDATSTSPLINDAIQVRVRCQEEESQPSNGHGQEKIGIVTYLSPDTDIVTSTTSPTSSPTKTPTGSTLFTLTLTDAEDLEIREANPSSTSRGNRASITVDRSDGGGKTQGLLKFPSLNLPSDYTIVSATLTIVSNNPTSSSGVISGYRMIQNWVETGTNWNSFADEDVGVATDDIEASDTESFTVDSPNNTGTKTIDVLNDVRAWVNDGVPNQGWMFENSSTNGFDFYSKDEGDANLRPKLVIEYYAGPTEPPSPSNIF